VGGAQLRRALTMFGVRFLDVDFMRINFAYASYRIS
jgi:hypothetical protein